MIRLVHSISIILPITLIFIASQNVNTCSVTKTCNIIRYSVKWCAVIWYYPNISIKKMSLWINIFIFTSCEWNGRFYTYKSWLKIWVKSLHWRHFIIFVFYLKKKKLMFMLKSPLFAEITVWCNVEYDMMHKKDLGTGVFIQKKFVNSIIP